MRNLLSRGIIAGSALLLLGSPVSVFGQAAMAATTGQALPAGPVRRLSVNEAVQLALEQNLNLQVQRIEPRVQDQVVAQARTSYTPTISSSLSSSSRKSPVNSFLAGATEKLTTSDVQASVSAGQNLPWGGNVNLSFDSSRSKTNNYFSGFNPALGSTFTFNAAQPLMRNFKIDNVRQQILVSRKNREISDVQLRQTVLGTVRSVKQAYWDLSNAVSSLAVQRQSLDLARESLRNNRSRVEIGTMAPIDIIAAEAEVALREEAVIVAEAALSQAEDRLRTLIFDPSTPDFWQMTLELTDTPTFQAQVIDAEAAVQSALAKRTDLQQAKKSLEVNDVNLRYFRNQLMPELSVQAGYTLMAQGGTKTQFGSGFPPTILGKEQINYGNMLGKIFGNDFPTWTLGVQFSYPIGTSAAEANLARARLQYTQAEIQIRSLELQAASQIRDIARQVTTNQKRVGATRVARDLAEKRLEAEQKKFAAGMSTSFLVFQAQRDLASARNNELNAILQYNKSLVDFETVQEAPVNGGGIVLAGSAGQ